MRTYPNLNSDQELLKIKTKDDEIRDLKFKTDEHDHGNILKSSKIENEHYGKKNENLIKKKILLIFTEILIGSGSAKGSSTMGLINPGARIIISTSTALLTSFAILITDENISKLKIRYTKLRDWIIVTTFI